MPSTKASRTTSAPTSDSSSLASIVLRVLLAGYYPLLVFNVVGSFVAIATLAGTVYKFPRLASAFSMLLVIVSLTVLHLLWALRVMFVKLKDFRDEMELRVPRELAPKLYAWVEDIAAERDLPAPDEIRVSADTVAHVYERVNGRTVLVLGAMGVRGLPQPALAGVVAHELAHLAAGDTTLGRQARRGHLIMLQLEWAFHVGRSGSLSRPEEDWDQVQFDLEEKAVWFNPAVWAVLLYHLVYALAHAAHSRECEYAADREEVKQSSAEVAAQTLILLTVAERMPWTRLSSMAENWAVRNDPPQLLFEDQARAARSIDPGEWQEAIRKELKRSTSVFDSHPGLKDRLAAMGISPKKAVRMTPQLSGPPSHLLFGQSWPKLEKELAERLLAPYRELHLAKMEAGQIISGFGRRGR